MKRVDVETVVIGALSTVSKKLEKWVDRLGIKLKIVHLRTNINAQQSTHNKAMIYKRNKFINRINVSFRLATSSEYE